MAYKRPGSALPSRFRSRICRHSLARIAMVASSLLISFILPMAVDASATATINAPAQADRYQRDQTPPSLDRVARWSHFMSPLDSREARSPNDGFGAAVAVDGDTAIIGAPENDGDGLDAGAAYVYVRSDDEWSFEARLSAPDSNDTQGFGFAVALQGDTAIIGAPRDGRAGVEGGVAYVFVRNGDAWSAQAVLQSSDASAGDRFGSSVALDGDTAIIGAPGDDSPQTGAGAAFVFVRSSDTWSEQARLTSAEPHPQDAFGFSVAISGDDAMVGAPRGDAGPELDAGTAEVFTRAGSIWTEETMVTAPAPTQGDRFGGAVALDGDTAVIGASRTADAPIADVGMAYVFVRGGTEWTMQARLNDPNPAEGDRFGFAVALDGDEALIGTPGDSPLTEGQGSAFLFVRAGAVWTEEDGLYCIISSGVHAGRSVAIEGEEALIGQPSLGSFHGPTGRACGFEPIEGYGWTPTETFTSPHDHLSDNMGEAVAVDGDTAVVGAPNDQTLQSNGGAAYVYVRTDGKWVFQAKLLPPLGGPGGIPLSEFGASVAIDGDTIVVGAPRHLAGPIPTVGSVHIFVRTGSEWSHQATLLDPQTGNYDAFGTSVAVEGDTALVGVPGYDVANVFVRDGDSWSLQSTLSDPHGEDGDRFGQSVALDHETALVGASKDDTPLGLDAGSAHVFVREGETWSYQATVTAPDGNPYAMFGSAVALVGATAVIGGPEGGFYASGPGYAYVFQWDGSAWSYQTTLADPDGSDYEAFGASLAFEGDSVLVGAWGKFADGVRYSGAAFVFVRSGESWDLQQMLVAPDRTEDDYLGSSVGLSDDVAIAGSPGDDLPSGDDAGSAYIYVRSGAPWTCQRKVKPRPRFI